MIILHYKQFIKETNTMKIWKHRKTTSAIMDYNLRQHHLKLFVVELLGWSLIATTGLCIAVALIA